MGLSLVEFTFGQYNCPLLFVIDTGLVVFNSFSAIFLGVIQNFAKGTEFTISGNVGFGLIGLVVTLIVLPVAVVVVGPVVLPSRAIAAPVEIGLKSSIL